MNLSPVVWRLGGGLLLTFGLWAAPGTSSLPPLPPPIAAPTGPVANGVAPRAAVNHQPGKAGVLEFDATSKHVDLNEDERKAAFAFAVTNRSGNDVTISYINTSCGCTAGKLPSSPWMLKPGEGGYIDVTMDLTGKMGRITKTATVVSSEGSYLLTVSANVPTPAPTAMNRSRNLQLAAADRQAVFRGDCAACHVQPTHGKVGRELYEAACGICHEAEHRASMVPDLRTRLRNTDRNYWAKWISDGRAGSLMPAFAGRNGGILTDKQIVSLVDYLEDGYKKDPPPSRYIPEPAAGPGASVTPAASATEAPRL